MTSSIGVTVQPTRGSTNELQVRRMLLMSGEVSAATWNTRREAKDPFAQLP